MSSSRQTSRKQAEFWRLQPGIESVITRPVGWHIYKEGLHLHYSPQTRIDGPVFINDPHLISSDFTSAALDFNIGYNHDITVTNPEIHNFDIGYLPSRRVSALIGGELNNYIDLFIGTCSNGTGCGRRPNEVIVRDTDLRTPSSPHLATRPPLVAWMSLSHYPTSDRSDDIYGSTRIRVGKF